MSRSIRKLWHFVLAIGTRDLQNEADARHVRITNAIAFSSAGLALSYLPSTFHLFRDHVLLPVAIGSILGLNIAYALVLYLNHKRQHWLAPTILATLVWVHVFVTTFVSGSDTGIHLYFMAYALGTSLLFPPRFQKTRMSFLVLGLVSLFLAETIAPETPIAGLDLPKFVLEFQSVFILIGIYVTVSILAVYYDNEMHAYEDILTAERKKSDTLLLNILPLKIADRLKNHEEAIANRHEDVTVLFSDIVGFTSFSDQYSETPEVVVGMLNELFRAIDRAAIELGCEKIKTIGDAYMVAAGIPEPKPDHASAIAQLAIKMIDFAETIVLPNGERLQMRIGIHTGPVVAGVIGSHKFAYDIWGDTVNIASRMESTGVPGRIQVSESAFEQLDPHYEFEKREPVEVKGKGKMNTYLLIQGSQQERSA